MASVPRMAKEVGRLDTRATLVKTVQTLDDMGAPLRSFDEECTLWCRYHEGSAKEVIEGNRRFSKLMGFFIFRYTPELYDKDATYRIRVDGEEFNVSGVLKMPSGRPRYIKFMAFTQDDNNSYED